MRLVTHTHLNSFQLFFACLSFLFTLSYFYLGHEHEAGLGFFILSALIGWLRYRFLVNSVEVARPGRTILWLFMELNFPIYLILQKHYWPHISLNPQFDMLGVTIVLMLVFFGSCEFLALLKKDPVGTKTYEYRKLGKYMILLLFLCYMVFGFGIGILGYSLGIGIMGFPEPDLPFKIPKIFLTFRVHIIPFIGILFADYFFEQKKDSQKSNFYLWIAVCYVLAHAILESILRGSRGQIFNTALFLLFWRIFKGNFNVKRVILISVMLLPTILISYFLFSGVRSTHMAREPMTIANVMAKTRVTNPLTTFAMYHRVFGNGYEIDKFSKYVDSHWTGLAWSKFTEIEGAGIGYHTQIIDKVKINLGHSSGINGIADGFLAFGYFGMVAMTMFFAWAFWANDCQKLGPVNLSAVGRSQVVILLFWSFFGGSGSISFLFRNAFFHIAFACMFVLQAILVKPVHSEKNHAHTG